MISGGVEHQDIIPSQCGSEPDKVRTGYGEELPVHGRPPITRGEPRKLTLCTTSGEVSRREKMALRRTEPESYIIEYTLVYEDDFHKYEQVTAVAATPPARKKEALIATAGLKSVYPLYYTL